MWGIGCIIAEMATKRALFAGDCEIDQLFQIFQVLGTPNENIWPGVSTLPDFKPSFPSWKAKDLNKILSNRFDQHGIKLMKSLLTYPPNHRITAKQALKSPWFDDVRQFCQQRLDPFYKKQQKMYQQILQQNYKRGINVNCQNNNPNGNSNSNSNNNSNQENVNPNLKSKSNSARNRGGGGTMSSMAMETDEI